MTRYRQRLTALFLSTLLVPIDMPATAQEMATDVRLISELPQNEWLLPSGDYTSTRYSPLNEITTGNVQDLKVAWTASTGIPRGHEGQPLVGEDALDIVTPFPNNLIAIDLANPDGPLKFVYRPYPDLRALGVACCDIVNRGATYADGRIVYTCK